MNSKIVVGTSIGLIIGLVLGVFVGVLVISKSGILPSKTGTGTNNQVQVSGTVPNRQTGTLWFLNLNLTMETTATITNGEYSVLLVGGQSYNIYNSAPENGQPAEFYTSDYNVFYVPLGVTTFTENLEEVP